MDDVNPEMMSNACLIEVGPASCSGIIIDYRNGIVITHGTLLLPYFNDHSTALKRLLKEGLLNSDALEGLKAKVIFEQREVCENEELPSSNISRIKTPHRYFVEPINLKASGADRLTSLEGDVKVVWRSDRFAKTLHQLFPSSEWKFYDDADGDNKKEKKQEISKDQVYRLLPYFILIKVPVFNGWTRTLNNSYNKTLDCLTVGANVFVVSTPFGNLSPQVFINSVSGGIVSNLAGERQELILTDARCIPGSEGGAIYSRTPFHSPVGMVVAPLCWKTNEWVGLAIGCHMSEILGSLEKTFHNSLLDRRKITGSQMLTSNQMSPLVENVPVVFVSSGVTWGSGILIHQDLGIIVTCSHVVNGAKEVKVRVDVPHFTWYTGQVVYATSEDQVFDVALVQLKDYRPRLQWPQTVSIQKNLSEGNEVFVIGHPAFGQEHKLKPTVTRGVISKVITIGNIPLIVQTTCSVNSGASGGAIVSKNGELLGVVVCNARDKDCGATYPHLNLSIPAVTVWPTINRYLESGKASILHDLTLTDPNAKLLWTLQGADNKMNIMKSRL